MVKDAIHHLTYMEQAGLLFCNSTFGKTNM